ncbi:MAG TPA: helix-turn-helix domain-containing protein [bacterium]|jgi:transcriptional regulator with XRE-family HTH domain
MTSSARITAIAVFCKELRQAREYQRITLREVAAVTRLGLDFLEAIEEGRWNDIPRAYIRGYLNLYAQAVGMNTDKVLKSFDRLMMPETESDAAILDEAPPLLRQPQAVDITRAKIRTTWFAVLSRNRKMLYLMSFFAVAGLLGLLYLTRRIEDRRAVPMLPFGEAMAESRTRVTSPFTILPLDDVPPGAKTADNWIQWVGNSRGWLVVDRDKDMPHHWHFDAYDTIKIQYVNTLSAIIYPAASAFAFRDTIKVPVSRVTPGDTAVYIIKPGAPNRPDSTKNLADSLVKG